MEFGALTELVQRVRNLAHGPSILIFGSSSLLVSFPSEPPSQLGVELTNDADLLIDPDDDRLRLMLSNELGEGRAFHRAVGCYGDFVDLRIAETFPPGWRDRLIPMPGMERVYALDPVDMCVTKIAATANSRLCVRLVHRRRIRATPAPSENARLAQ